jgi:hypothetical protein
MSGRDPHEPHRTATPLELLFDLTFVVAFVAGTAATLAAAVVLADRGLSLAWSLVVAALAPVVTIVGYEAVGHRHLQDHLTKLRA